MAQARQGVRTAAACGARQVFTVRLTLPVAGAARARQVAEGLLDTRLPFPVEESRYVLAEGGGTSGQVLMAFAMPRPKLQERLDELRARGCDPAFATPEALALWRRYTRETAIGADERHVLIRTGTADWTLVVGAGRHLVTATTFPAGDGAAVRRTLQVLAGESAPGPTHWFLCGPQADPATWQRFCLAAGLPDTAPVRRPVDAVSYLAGAIALDGLREGCHSDQNLRPPDALPPAVQRSRQRRQDGGLAALAVAALLVIGADLAAWRQARGRLVAADRCLAGQVQELADHSVAMRGAAAVAAARQELDARLHPVVEALTEPNRLRPIADLLQIAALRQVSLHTLRLEDRRLTLTGTAQAEGDIDALELALKRAGLSARLSRNPRAGSIEFTGIAVEGMP